MIDTCLSGTNRVPNTDGVSYRNPCNNESTLNTQGGQVKSAYGSGESFFNMYKLPFSIVPFYGNLVGSYSPFSITFITLHTQSSQRHCKNTGSRRRPLNQKNLQSRGYSDVRSKKLPADHLDDLGWPALSSTSLIPTPYQIFHQKKSAPYSKRRFYELVKLYHPDLCSQEQSLAKSLPSSVKIERYLLVVAANIILSDPTKRTAYDRFGSGWDGHLDAGVTKYGWDRNNNNGCSGFGAHDSPANNATWEDWERWYQRDTKPKQEPLHFSNGGFFVIVVILIALGGIGQVTKLGGYSNPFLERMDKVHDDCSKGIRSRRQVSQRFGNKDERVERFLQTRDPYGYGVLRSRNKTHRPLLPPPDDCMND